MQNIVLKIELYFIILSGLSGRICQNVAFLFQLCNCFSLYLQFAANYARDNLIKNLNNKVIELKKMIAEGKPEKIYSNANKPPPSPQLNQKKLSEGAENLSRKSSFRKTASQADECVKKSAVVGGGVITDPLLLEKLEALNRPITREVRPTRASLSAVPAPKVESYLDAGCAINYGRLLTDEVLAADRLLVEAAKKTMDVAGRPTTFYISILYYQRFLCFSPCRFINI